jgi:hypothetical protein
MASAMRRLDALLLPGPSVAAEKAAESPAVVLKAAVAKVLGSGGTESTTHLKAAKKVGGPVKRVVNEDTVGQTGAVEAQVWACT